MADTTGGGEAPSAGMGELIRIQRLNGPRGSIRVVTQLIAGWGLCLIFSNFGPVCTASPSGHT